ncbi:GMC family oxidoreductase [Mesorhizobium sp. M0166]|uniref:GMC family oxidoreductase n=1 Tax=unclassified Mesorhizobium TaxID=325217 RepID=UPI00333AE3A1
MAKVDFVVIGSSGGGGTIAWQLGKAGFRVVVLELGADWSKPLHDQGLQYNPIMHDEHRFRLARPELKRRPRGDYNTHRRSEADAKSAPIGTGWTASMLGGGSVIWGAWSFRALPIDFRLGTHFGATGQLDQLNAQEGYSVVDWPIGYAEMEPYYNIAEALLSVCGSRNEITRSVLKSTWYEALKHYAHFQPESEWEPNFAFPSPPYPITPVGAAVERGMDKQGWTAAPLPSGMVAPGSGPYSTRAAIAETLRLWDEKKRPEFWNRPVEELWSSRARDPCNMCGFCGEYLCWGLNGPKSGALASTLQELRDLPNVEVITNARAFEIVYDEGVGRATGVRYLNVRDPDDPRVEVLQAGSVVVSCGAVQSARLMLMSGPQGGLGNRHDQVGRNVMFHLFGLGSTYVLPGPYFQGMLHGELGHTGNTTSFDLYFVKEQTGAGERWWKAGNVVSTAKKNPMENAVSKVEKGKLIGRPLLESMEDYNRTMEVRITGDDLPMPANRVDLDPEYVDEYGFPVARITRDFGPAERRMFGLTRPLLEKVWETYTSLPVKTVPKSSDADVGLIGDHQMGTCRMGDDPRKSVVDRHCRVHDVPNLYVVDSSFMPTGLGLNPMVTVVANALRVGSWIIDEAGNDAQVE